jgi:hypothetical protein
MKRHDVFTAFIPPIKPRNYSNVVFPLSDRSFERIYRMADDILVRGYAADPYGRDEHLNVQDFVQVIKNSMPPMSTQLFTLSQDHRDALEILKLQGITLESYRQTRKMLGT